MSVMSLGRLNSKPGQDPRSVLIVDDEPTMRVALAEALRRNGYGVTQAIDGQNALDQLASCKPWLVLTDLKMPRIGGIALIKEIKKRAPQTQVVIMTAYGTVETAVEAMKHGAVDFLLKPFAAEHLEQVLAHLEDTNTATPPEETAPVLNRPILTQDPNMARVLSMAEGVAPSQATVLIHGESGTGKELLARFIHNHSPRAHRPFVAVNCAALPDGLLESELFGHERGAFTGALMRKIGKFEMAHNGTLLLDEISEMNLGLQAKLLRVLQEREVDRIGGREPIHVNIRVISTTNRSLLKEVEQGRFREDLYYRLNVFPITLPPLRDRPADLPLLVRHFVKSSAVRNSRPVPDISDGAFKVLSERSWKGNIRELENVMERAVLLASGGAIEAEHVRLMDGGQANSTVVRPLPAGEAPTGSLWDMERDLVMRTLARLNGNRTHAAKALGISIRTLRNKLREYRQLAEPLRPDPSYDGDR
ncbi:MAG TPA: sigma-54 dependent transcriptional regulator [Nitrospiraceae bacterium]|nr:sigma-54 dependent transcriptional regulator [Nitrospiraceae bacterium]